MDLTPWLLHIELTNRCNASCVYCAARYGKPPAGDMDFALYKRIIDSCPSVTRVHPHGFGEPLLYPLFPEAVEYASEKGKQVVVYTNGSLLDADLGQRVLDAGIAQVVFSIDAADRETYERIRRGLSWDAVVANVETFRRLNDAGGYGVFTTVRYTKAPENAGVDARMVAFWEPWVDKIVGISEVDVPPQAHARWQDEGEPVRCGRPWQHLSVDSGGRMTLCCNDWWSAYVFGIIPEDGAALEIFNSAEFDRVRAAMQAGREYPKICDYCQRSSTRVPLKKVVCLMAVHRREAVTVETIRILRRQTVPVMIVLVGDSDVERGIAEREGCLYVQHPNSPLSDKQQAGLDRVRELDPDAVLTVGSDDWISPNWCEVALPYLEDYDVVGRNDWYNLHVQPGGVELVRTRYPGARRGEVLSPGRLISRRALDKLGWQLWPPGLNRRLDRAIYFRLREAGCKVKVLNDVQELKLLCLKGPWSSLTSWEQLVDAERGGMVVDPAVSDPVRWLAESFPDAAEAASRLTAVSCPDVPLVSVCMIVKDEEAIVEEAVKSTEGLADEIMVLDTGSSDGTVALLRKLGARVLTGGDRMHKGQSRNQAISAARGEWVVILDADERIADPTGMRRFLEETDAQAVYIRLAFMGEGDQQTLSYPQMRAWRRGTFEYKYRAHEVPLPTGAWGKTEKTDFVWEHRPPRNRTWKSRYTLERLLLDVEENPDAARPLFYLGRQYMYRKEWEESIDALQRYLDMTGTYDRAEAYGCLATCYGALGRSREQAQALYRACDEQPKRRVWWGRLAEYYRSQGEHRLAVGLLKCALELRRPASGYVHHSWYGAHIYDLLARCYWKLREYREGLRWAQRAVELAPDSQRLRDNLRCFERQRDAVRGPGFYDGQHQEYLEANPSLGEVKLLSRAAAQHVVGSVLDLGCGLGALANCLDGHEYLGVDFSSFAVGYARQHCQNPNARFLEHDIRRLPDDLGQFDTVVMLEVLEHVWEKEVVTEIARQRARKRVVVSVPKASCAEGHVWPQWERADLEALFGDLSVFETIGSRGRYLLAVCEV